MQKFVLLRTWPGVSIDRGVLGKELLPSYEEMGLL